MKWYITDSIGTRGRLYGELGKKNRKLFDAAFPGFHKTQFFNETHPEASKREIRTGFAICITILISLVGASHLI